MVSRRVSGQQTRYVNKIEGRSGTLWEGRYKSSPIDKDEYLLICCRYVELNPVRAGIVRWPENYRWSSYKRKIGGEPVDWLDLDQHYTHLGSTAEEWVKGSIPATE